MKTAIVLFLLAGSIVSKKVFSGMDERVFIAIHSIALLTLGYLALNISAHLRANRLMYGKFLPYNYFCLGVLLVIIVILALAGMIVVSTPKEVGVITIILRVITIIALIGVVVIKKYFKKEKIKDATYL